MTSLDQHVLVNMQKVERTRNKVDRTSNIVARLVDFVAGSFDLDKSIDIYQKFLRHSSLLPVCTGL